MIIPRGGRAFIIALFILAPLMGLAVGVAAGVHLSYQSVDTSAAAVDDPAVSETQRAANSVVLPGGEQVGLDELAPGRTVAIVVMKDANCPVCQRQLRVLSEKLHEVKRQDGAVFGLSDAPRCVNQRLMHRMGLNFPILADTNQEVLRSLGMDLPNRQHVMPGVIFLDENGEITEVHKGRSPGQRQEAMILNRLR